MKDSDREMLPLSKTSLFLPKVHGQQKLFFAQVNQVYQEVYLENYVPARNTKEYEVNICSNGGKISFISLSVYQNKSLADINVFLTLRDDNFKVVALFSRERN